MQEMLTDFMFNQRTEYLHEAKYFFKHKAYAISKNTKNHVGEYTHLEAGNHKVGAFCCKSRNLL